MPNANARHSRAERQALRLALAVAIILALPLAGATATPIVGQTPSGNGGTAMASTVPGSELRVWLVTVAPGDAVWERYGHNAIRLLDTRTGRDVSYNWGIFDFEQENFIARFLLGRMLYMMATYPTEPMLDAYRGANREIVLQELALTPEQKVELRDLADLNARPENREYIYHYYLDNCSTRVRDLLDRVLGGALRTQFASMTTGTTYRFHTNRLTQPDPLIHTGIDLLLGTASDQQISVWEEMFVPMTLRDRIRDMAVVDDEGAERPLVLSEEIASSSTRAGAPAAPPRWLPIYLLIGIAIGGSLAAAASDRAMESTLLRRSVTAVAVAWAVLGGVMGLLLVGLLFTDHDFAHRNENLFLFNPLLLVVAALVPRSLTVGRWHARARAWALAIVGIALVGLLWQLAPASRQENARFFALALPAHLGLAYALIRRRPSHPAGHGGPGSE